MAELVTEPTSDREQPRIAAKLAKIAHALSQWAANAGLSLEPVQPMAQPMGEEPQVGPATYRLDDDAEIRAEIGEDGATLHLEIAATGDATLEVALTSGGEVLQQDQARPGGSPLDLFADLHESLQLSVRIDPAGKVYQIPLA